MSISLSIQLITVSLITLQRQYSHDLTASRNTWSDSYDYIVVGAGSAGAVVAYRLAEKKNKVLLLEAGGAQNIVTDTPGFGDYGLNSLWDWNYTSVPQVNYGWATNSIIAMHRAKIIGGSSNMNAMIYNRGNKRDFDVWAHKYGAQGWAYEEVLPYFLKSENNTDLNIVRQNSGYHSTRGRMKISSDPNPQPIYKYGLKAFNELGFETIDINGAKQLGAAILQYTSYEGIRSSTGNAYIDPNPFPRSLHILTKAHVIQVLIQRSSEGLKAFGVHFIRDNKLYEVKVKKEVILSAGVFGSPQLLMLSGIGPKEHLKQHNITVIRDLPVGQNLQDHPNVNAGIAILREGVQYYLSTTDISQIYELYAQKSGPLTKLTFLGSYMNTVLNSDKLWPNIMTLLQFNGLIDESTAKQYTNRTEEWIRYFKPYLNKIKVIVGLNVEKFKSRGTVRLASNDPLDYPLIDPKYFSNPQDFEDAVEGVELLFDYLLNTFLSNHLYLIPEPIPGCDQQICLNASLYECDPYIRCWVRSMGLSSYHPVGTCRMGAVNRGDVVVDPTLRVKGIGGLRVCDASIMPLIINSNTNAAAIMIGEKCSDTVLRKQ